MKKLLVFIEIIAIAGIVLSWHACSDDPPSKPAIGDGTLAVGTPAEQNIDESKLDAAYQQARQTDGLRSLLVARNGVLVAEQYFSGFNQNRLNHVRSVTKSVMATLIGIALREGFILSTNQTIAEFLQPVTEVDLTDQKSQITIEHLLTMTSGFEWHETGGNEYGNWITSSNQIDYVLSKPLVSTPGQSFVYNSATSHLLSVILTRASGMTTKEFADKYLFEPLGIYNVNWERASGGFYNGGAGLELVSRDMIKFGLLYLQNGQHAGQQLVPMDWLQRVWTQQRTLGFSFSAMQSVHYGFLWWMDKGGPHDAYLAWGYGGQFIYVVPDLQLIVTTTSRWQLSGADATGQERANLDLIINNVVAAVRE